MEYNCAKAVLGLPCTKGNENMLNREGSTYFPDAYIGLLSMENKSLVSFSDMRQVLAMPGISACMAGPITPGVDPCVNTRAFRKQLTRAKNKLSFFSLKWSRSRLSFNPTNIH